MQIYQQILVEDRELDESIVRSSAIHNSQTYAIADCMTQ